MDGLDIHMHMMDGWLMEWLMTPGLVELAFFSPNITFVFYDGELMCCALGKGGCDVGFAIGSSSYAPFYER